MKKENLRKPNLTQAIPVTARLLSIFISILVLALLVYVSGSATAYLYELRHPLPKGEDDLGFGLVILFWAITAFACAVPMFFLLYRFLLKRISQYLGGK